MRTVAFVTSQELADLADGDLPLFDAFQDAGLRVYPAVWTDPSVHWGRFDLILIRTPWDYHQSIDAFLSWLDAREGERAFVINPIALLRWNLNKRYLADLAAGGAATVPTIFVEKGARYSLQGAFASMGWQEVVVKPQVSGGAFGTWRCTRDAIDDGQARLDAALAERSMMIQPFMREIESRGEWSLIYFGDVFSHAVIKRAAPGDFRVQSEHGGTTSAATPGQDLLAAASRAITVARRVSPLLYARVDLIETDDGPLIMELELIEPELFFPYDVKSAERFVSQLFATATEYPFAGQGDASAWTDE